MFRTFHFSAEKLSAGSLFYGRNNSLRLKKKSSSPAGRLTPTRRGASSAPHTHISYIHAGYILTTAALDTIMDPGFLLRLYTATESGTRKRTEACHHMIHGDLREGYDECTTPPCRGRVFLPLELTITRQLHEIQPQGRRTPYIDKAPHPL